MNPWREAVDRIEAQDVEGLAELLAGMGELGKKAIAVQLPKYLRERLAGGEERWDSWEARWEVRDRAEGFRLVGAACLGGAAQVADWLNRRELRDVDRPEDDAARIMKAIAHRPAEWRADLASRLVEKLRPSRARDPFRVVPGWHLAIDLVVDTGIVPPQSDVLVAGWAWRLAGSRWMNDPAELVDDPLLELMAGRLFEAEGVAAALRWSQQRYGGESAVSWLAGRAADGLLKRSDLLAGCLGHFLVGGEDREVAPFVALWRELAPEPGDAPARDLVRLLPTAAPSLAQLAIDELRRVEPVDPELFAEAVAALAFRPEKKLVAAALRWIGERAQAQPATAAGRRAQAQGSKRTLAQDVLPALATVLGNDTLALRDRAVRLAVRLGPHATETERQAVREAAESLPTEVRERLAGVYGAIDAAPADPVLLSGPVAVPLPALQPPIASMQELADELEAHTWPDPLQTERLLAALVTFAHHDRPALRQALQSWRHDRHYANDDYPQSVLFRCALSIGWPGSVHPSHSRAAQSTLQGFVLRRLWEVADMLDAGPGLPVLLATPTSPTGHVDAETLIDRLELLGDAEPLHADFHQALLRLPRHVDQSISERAEGLGTPAGRELVRWLRTWPLDPEVTCRVTRSSSGYGNAWPMVTITPPDSVPATIGHLWKRSQVRAYEMSWWPLIMPSHREVVAAHLLEALEYTRGGALVAALAHADGPLESALSAAIGALMTDRTVQERAYALDALITLAARGELEPELGQVLAVLVRNELAQLNRITSVLREAFEAGLEVWPILAMALPGLLPGPDEHSRSGLGELVALAARAAEREGAKGEIPGLADVAARGGASRLVEEARRLHNSLGVETYPH